MPVLVILGDIGGHSVGLPVGVLTIGIIVGVKYESIDYGGHLVGPYGHWRGAVHDVTCKRSQIMPNVCSRYIP